MRVGSRLAMTGGELVVAWNSHGSETSSVSSQTTTIDSAASRRLQCEEPPNVATQDLTPIFPSEQAAVAAAYRDHGYSLREIGEHLSCHYSTVSRRLRREEGSVLQCKT